MYTINKQQLKDLCACKDGLKRFITATDNTAYDIDVIDLIGSDVTTSDLLWLAGKLSPKKKIVQFAVDCAESVVHLSINKELAQNCIDAAKAVIENDNETTRAAARAAAAYAAATANGLVAAAANSAAAYAEWAAATAEWAAAAAADACATARADSNFDVKPLLIKLFT